MDAEVAQHFIRRFHYVSGDHTEASPYRRLFDQISGQRQDSCENVVFYLAIPPDHFLDVVRHLDRAGLNSLAGQHRIVVEKPFGTDLDSARKLNSELHRHYKEEQIFRIDHYLGKETVQNVLVFRFANSVIEPLWNLYGDRS